MNLVKYGKLIEELYDYESIDEFEEILDDIYLSIVQMASKAYDDQGGRGNIFEYLEIGSDEILKVISANRDNSISLPIDNLSREQKLELLKDAPYLFKDTRISLSNEEFLELIHSTEGEICKYAPKSLQTYDNVVQIVKYCRELLVHVDRGLIDFELFKYAVTKDSCLTIVSEIKDISDEEIEYCVQVNPDAILKIKNPSEEAMLVAVEKSPYLISKINEKYLTPQVLKKAIEIDSNMIIHVKGDMLTEELCLLSVSKEYGISLQHIPEDVQTEDICLESVRINGLNLKYAHVQTEEVVQTALENNPLAKIFIKRKKKRLAEIKGA